MKLKDLAFEIDKNIRKKYIDFIIFLGYNSNVNKKNLLIMFSERR